MLEYKLATFDDLDSVIEMVNEHLALSPYDNVNPVKVETVVIDLIEKDDGLAVMVMDGDKPVGLLLAKTIEMIFSDDKVAFEIVLYSRHPLALSMLKKAYEYWAAVKQRTTAAMLSVMPSPKAHRLASVYTNRWGYAPVEQSFMKRF
jgi:hypothetical protein